MKITAIVVGRASAPMKDAILEYETRVGRYWKFKVIEVASGGAGGATPSRSRQLFIAGNWWASGFVCCLCYP